MRKLLILLFGVLACFGMAAMLVAIFAFYAALIGAFFGGIVLVFRMITGV